MVTSRASTGMRILLADIETSPALVYCWGLRDQNIGLNQIVEPTKILCWAAKWYGEDEPVHFGSLKQRKPLQMLGKIHRMIDEADVIVHYNGKSFDMKHLNREFLEYGFPPPSPYKQVDLLQAMRSNFRFLSNKMQYVLEKLEVGEKENAGGMETWLGCLKGKPESWDMMKKYNIADVVEMEKLYTRVRPWIKNHPNRALYEAHKEQCPACGSEEFQHRGWYTANSYRYRMYSCKKCDKRFRSVKSEGGRQAVYTGVS